MAQTHLGTALITGASSGIGAPHAKKSSLSVAMT